MRKIEWNSSVDVLFWSCFYLLVFNGNFLVLASDLRYILEWFSSGMKLWSFAKYVENERIDCLYNFMPMVSLYTPWKQKNSFQGVKKQTSAMKWVKWSWIPLKHFRIDPASIYLSKVNNRNSRKRCKICSKLTMTSFWCFY